MADDSKRRVLIVDDHPDTVRLLQAQLAGLELDVRVAFDGQQAILATGSRLFDLVIMDLMMPELDGLEASRYFKSKFAHWSLPILVLTAKHDEAVRQQAAEIGCDDFLLKPYDVDDLIESVKDLLELGRLENTHIKLNKQRSKKKKTDWVALDQEMESLAREICRLHASLAQRLLERGLAELVPMHLERIASLVPDHESLVALKSQMG